MKPERDVRRKVIREWMSLPRDTRQTQEQAAAPFAMKAAETRAIGPQPRGSLPENHVLAVTQDRKSLAFDRVASTSPDRKSAGGRGKSRDCCVAVARLLRLSPLLCRANLSSECRVDQAPVTIGLRKNGPACGR